VENLVAERPRIRVPLVFSSMALLSALPLLKASAFFQRSLGESADQNE
jgi:hypothetical protein